MPLIINELLIEVPVERDEVAGDRQPPAATGGDASLPQLRQALALAEERQERLDVD